MVELTEKQIREFMELSINVMKKFYPRETAGRKAKSVRWGCDGQARFDIRNSVSWRATRG